MNMSFTDKSAKKNTEQGINLTRGPIRLDQLSLKPKKKFSFIKAIVWVGVLTILIVGGIYITKIIAASQVLGLRITPENILQPLKKDPVLKKDSTGKYTSALLVGVDTRAKNNELKNTDSIIIATYNHETKETTMFSIPRDFYMKIPNDTSYTKINALYSIGETKKKGDGLNYLKKALESITGIQIQYYAMIDLEGFRSVIDIMGGITVNVQNTFTDYCYPAEKDSKNTHFCGGPGGINGMAETITFTKGTRTMNGSTALKYARSRHSPDNGEGLDYARSRRQQNVLIAVKNKLLSSETLLNPPRILEIMQALQNNLKLSEFTPEDIQAAINLFQAQKESNGKTFSNVLDPYFGGGKVMTSEGINAGGLSVIGPKAGLDNYKEIKKAIALIQENPSFYSENSVIRVYDTGMGYQKAYQKTVELQTKYPYSDIIFQGTLFTDKTGNVVYSHAPKENTATVKKLTESLKPETLDRPSYIKTNLNGEDVTILLGKLITTTQTTTTAQ